MQTTPYSTPNHGRQHELVYRFRKNNTRGYSLAVEKQMRGLRTRPLLFQPTDIKHELFANVSKDKTKKRGARVN